MDTFIRGIDNINNIYSFTKKGNKWYYRSDKKDGYLEEGIDELERFLASYNQFVNINSREIVNLNHVNDCLLNIDYSFFVLKDKFYNVPRKYLSKVRATYKNHLLQKYCNNIVTHKKLSEKHNKTIKNNVKLEELDFQEIKYLIREGVTTKVYFTNGNSRKFYETLAFFENCFSKNTFCVRINRNFIINIRCVEHFKVSKTSRIGVGEIIIDSQKIQISRRLLPTFKQAFQNYQRRTLKA